jgi:hypothetical protein
MDIFRPEYHFLLFLNKYETVKYYHIISIILFSISININAQYYDTGQDPASIKWKQIKTSRFRVIYPASYGLEGVRFARSLDDSYTKLTSLYSANKFRIPVIIHNYTTFSNGYVAWAPKRIEIYPTPEQDGIPLDPVEQLATHELTHVLQMVSLNKGFTRAMSVLSGEQFTGATAVLLPLWFMEGDAVFAESLLSPSGRGRTPAFQKELKAIALENPKMYSYDKMISKSFKNFIPDHYHFGYQMIAWSYARYGPQLWNKAIDYTAKNPYTINPINLSLRKNAGLTKSMLYSETFDSLKSIWKREELKTNPVNYEALNPLKKRNYIDYHSPVLIGKDSVIAIKTSLTRSPEFVLINLSDRSEKRFFTPGYIYTYNLSGSAGKIAWVENRPDPRWENRTYNVIKIMDIPQKTIRQLSVKSRYMAVSISPDGIFVAAVENTISNVNRLVIINAMSGDVVNKIPVPENAYPQRPNWSADGDNISIVFLSVQGEGVMSYSLKHKEWKVLLNAGRDDLQSAFLRNDSLFFVSSCCGNDNIYVLAPDQSISKLTNSRFGAYDPSPAEGSLLFTDYTVSGYNLCRVSLRNAQQYSGRIAKDPSFLINRFDTIKITTADLSLTDYKPVPYRKWSHPFRFHSWMPFYADLEKIQADPASVRPGVTIMSQNLLSTVISSFGYEYTSEKTHMFHSGITLKGWYPVIESRLDYGGTAVVLKPDVVKNPGTIQPDLNFRNTISLPLNFSTGRFSQYLQPSLTAEYRNKYIHLRDTATFHYGQTLITGRLFFYNYHRSVSRDIYPKWAQLVDFSYTFAPFDRKIYGSLSTLKTAFYFPGVIRNHGIRVRFEKDIQKPEKYIFYNMASFPRSYKNIISEELKFYSVEYVMPLLYPDLNIPGIVFVPRIRSTFFYDYAIGSKNKYLDTKQFNNKSEIFKSFGAELWADFYLFRIPFMISPGIQTTWKNFNEPPVFELMLKVDIFGMKIGRNRL